MRYTRLLGRILKAAENLKIDGANINFPEAVGTQILMWIMWLKEVSDYSDRELLKIQVMLLNYLEVEA